MKVHVKSFQLTSSTRLAVNMTMISLSILLLVQSLGMIPDNRQAETEARVSICESLAVNCSILAHQNQLSGIKSNLEAFLSRNRSVRSAALRGIRGDLLATAGPHDQLWMPAGNGKSDPSNVQVPISRGEDAWGQLEVCFYPVQQTVSVMGIEMAPWVRTALVITLFNGLLFTMYLSRILQHLDPTKAVPSRVRTALDSLSEGLLVLDLENRIVLANKAFQQAVGTRDVVGRVPQEFPWDNDTAEFWSGERSDDATLTLNVPGGQRKFLVNCTEIRDDNGAPQGTLVTFNDVTVLENNRERLMDAMVGLQNSRDKIQEQNQQLQVLATRDPLTNCWNRRAFFEEMHNHWKNAVSRGVALSAVMVDVDHFKGVNDNFGHAVGDRVLREVSAALRHAVRPTDYVCRYGGEEFCVLLPGTQLEVARKAANRFRQVIEAVELGEKGLQVTASLGVSSICLEAGTPEEMLEQADKSLYMAKRNGRNQVVCWQDLPNDISYDDPELTRAFEGDSNESTVPFQVVTSLLSALSFRDPETAAHSMRVADLSFLTGQGLMTASELYMMEVGSLLHDIGKIGVPDSILLKPGQLSSDEWQVMSRQARIGCEIVEAAFDCEAVEEILRYCQTPFGDARPGQLHGEEIPLAARIVNIADAFDAMVTDRVYRKGRTAEEAYAELRRCSGKQFDPELVERFIDVMESQPTDERRSSVDASTSKQLALHLGQSTDRIARAFDEQDFETLQAQAQRLVETARKYDNKEIEKIASRLAQSAGEEDEVSLVLAAVLELLEACRITQHACLSRSEALAREDEPTCDAQENR